MTKTVIDENEGKIVSASGHSFLIRNGVRHWISTPPKGYVMMDGTKFLL
tara:strand:+ start:303 stop:449 length:147 start_codon:yes stop_codon:yes gene_type:complete